MKRIYLDNSATTKPDCEVVKVMEHTNSKYFGNASSIHSFGQEARKIVDQSRLDIAKILNCKPSEIIFTSGGSESDNLAIMGIIEASNIKKPHLITSEIEHHAILDTVKELERGGSIEATYIKPDKNGVVKAEGVEKAIKENTVLVSIMYVNNEIGTVEPIRQIGKMIEKINEKRLSQIDMPHTTDNGRIYFHTDAVQVPEYFDLNVEYLHLDLLTLSAHKFYGPKGIGILYKRGDLKLKHQIIGGDQEYKLRAGTENVAAIAGMAEAFNRIKNNKLRIKKTEKLRNKLIKGLLKIPNSRLNGCKVRRSPNNLNISFKNAEGESILMMLDQKGIAASSGSACTSNSLEPSHVLEALGVSPKWSHGSVRFSLGKDTTSEEIDKVIEVMPNIIKKLREMSPLK